MIYFYKIQDNKAILGSGTKLPDNTFIEYDRNNKPQELVDALAYKSPEELLAEWKQQRELLVSQIVVEYNGIEYQGDEKSQDRMSRAINGLPDDTTILWTSADNSQQLLNKVDLKSILGLAGAEQSRLWTRDG